MHFIKNRESLGVAHIQPSSVVNYLRVHYFLQVFIVGMQVNQSGFKS